MPSLLLAFAFGTASPQILLALTLRAFEKYWKPSSFSTHWSCQMNFPETLCPRVFVFVFLYLFIILFCMTLLLLLMRYSTQSHVLIQWLYKINKQIRIDPLLLTIIFHLTCLPYHFLRKLLDKILINPDRQISSTENSSRTLSIVPSYSDVLPYSLWSITCNS